MYEGYQKIKKNLTLGFNRVSEIARGYRKYQEGIGNDGRVSEILGGYRKCTKSIGNEERVSDMYEGYRKIKKT